jgi:hypothetical protein
MMFNYQQTRKFIEDACENYAKSAPALTDWLDETYIALADNPETVSVYELLQLQQLQMDGEWEHPNFAQNRWYKLRASQGKDHGILSF